MSISENGECEGWNLSFNSNPDADDAEKIAQKIKPYLKIAIDCGLSDTNGICAPNSIYKKLNGTNHQSYNEKRGYYKIKLLNGSSVWFRAANAADLNDNVQIVFFIDTNGAASPNTFGIDMFTFRANNYSIRGSGSPYDIQKNTCNKKSTGFGCAYYVLSQNNMNYLH